jgi:hypothetical protein
MFIYESNQLLINNNNNNNQSINELRFALFPVCFYYYFYFCSFIQSSGRIKKYFKLENLNLFYSIINEMNRRLYISGSIQIYIFNNFFLF